MCAGGKAGGHDVAGGTPTRPGSGSARRSPDANLAPDRKWDSPTETTVPHSRWTTALSDSPARMTRRSPSGACSRSPSPRHSRRPPTRGPRSGRSSRGRGDATAPSFACRRRRRPSGVAVRLDGVPATLGCPRSDLEGGRGAEAHPILRAASASARGKRPHAQADERLQRPPV
jgi:hypothetical protein